MTDEYFDIDANEQLEFAIYSSDYDSTALAERRKEISDNFSGISPSDLNGELSNKANLEFEPFYYPSRFTIKTEKELERTAAACEGQRVRIKELKNSELHVKGKIHSSDLPSLQKLRTHQDTVEVITPAIVGGGMEAYIKSAEQGQMLGYDAYPERKEYMFEYTIDLVSTGKDEYDSHKESRLEVPRPERENDGFGL